LPIIGKFDTVVESKKRITVASIHVVKGNSGSLLSYQTASELNMITLHVNKVSPSVSSNDIAKKYPGIYNGIGKLKNFEVKLHIDKQVPPVAQSARRVGQETTKRNSDLQRKRRKRKVIPKKIRKRKVIPKKMRKLKVIPKKRRKRKVIMELVN
jgi:hypothetical protein